ncbi:MAG: hypothetical protein KAH23_09480 [Kiritimatiellae bacterium]|nr:hypothetical protein [Kiritimatiellia bacterium]
MNGIRTYGGIALLCFGLLCGCSRPEPSARVPGIVRWHADTYPSGTGGSADLVRGSQMRSGRDYADAEKTDWTSDIQWELVNHRGKRDVYRFTCIFSPSSGTSVSRTEEVEYDGARSVIVFQNEWQTISIEPGSIPLPENSQPSVPGDA